MNEMQDTGKWYEDVPYQECKSIIKERLTSMSRDFISVGYYLKYIRDKKLYKEDGYASVWEFAESNYGIKMSTASRWMAMNDKFSQGGILLCWMTGIGILVKVSSRKCYI